MAHNEAISQGMGVAKYNLTSKTAQEMSGL
jgi:hypothetical protein